MNPNASRLTIEKLFRDQGKNFVEIETVIIPSWPAGLRQVIIEEVETREKWIASYRMAEEDNPDHQRALQWKKAARVANGKWVAIDSD